MNEQDWAEIKGAYRAFWPNAPAMGPETWQIWRGELEGFGPDALPGALRQYSHEGHEFPPPVGVWAKTCTEAVRSLRPTFGEFLLEMRANACGAEWDSTPEDFTWSYPVFGEAARQLGWSEFMNSDPADRDPLLARARRIFDDAVDRGDDGAAMLERITMAPELAALAEGIGKLPS